ncbi:MAG: type II toxin-antitoxin system HicB family antitoxin [Candidatus Tectomicrobia bacterium]|uniref:Type II toxin-antitoxin system HicB family antitoxin n=1 Tax=Tectimicrobiota bacterium TaxID=2528274 RepID=A0A932GQV8_UNCTE|nr:type II toxin-antitoxin system HicB family antitoxin [Candidatus Tectomicrobia bacterium]
MVDKTPEEYLREPYARILIPESEGGFSAEILEFPGCYAVGKTPDETFENLEEVAKAWIEAELEQGHEIPPPSTSQASGKIALRLPRSLHQQAIRMAERDGTSLNQFIVTAVAARVGAEDLYIRMAQQFSQRFVYVMSISTKAEIVEYQKLVQPMKISQTAGTGVSSKNPPHLRIVRN